MNLKVNSANEFCLTLRLNISYKKKEISIEVEEWDKIKHIVNHHRFSANEFALALDKYAELEKSYGC